MRPSLDEYFLEMARLVATRSTCVRRHVGCVLVDKRRRVLATGYNGVARNVPHCIDVNCAGASSASGTDLDKCHAIHAEQNAIIQCSDVDKIEAAYITTSPCVACTKLFLNTGCRRLVFIEEYTNTSAKDLWKGEWIHHGPVKFFKA